MEENPPSPSIPTIEAKFTSNLNEIVEHKIVEFRDLSEGTPGTPASWQWTFEGGSPPSSAAQNPIIRYHSTGSFDVKLIVGNNFVYDTIEVKDYITVVEGEPGPTVEFDIIYGNDLDSHRLDLYHPFAMDSIIPLVIVMGGNFSAGGNRNNLVPIAEALNDRGIAVAATSYRKIDAFQGEGFAEALVKSQQDSKTVVKYFKAHADEWGINKDFIFAGGFSNGATAALNHAFWDIEEFTDDEIAAFLTPYGGLDKSQGWDAYSSDVAGVIAFSGVFYSNSFPENYIDTNDPPYFGVCVLTDMEITCEVGVTPGGSNVHGVIPLDEACQKAGLISDIYLYQEGIHQLPRLEPEAYVDELMEWINQVIGQ